MDDPEGRRTLVDYLPRKSERLFHIGRLDTDTEGLILLTNDGEFAHRLSHPSFEVPKTYVAEVAGIVDQRTIQRLEKGLRLEDGPVKPDRSNCSRAVSRVRCWRSPSTRAATASSGA